MKNPILLCLFLALGTVSASSQNMGLFDQYNKDRLTISKHGMSALGCWSLGNIAAGTAGALSTPLGSEANSFHQANIYWNLVNFGIALPGYLGAKKQMTRKFTVGETFKEQRRQETIFLLNAGLDLGYLGIGVFLREYGNRYSTKTDGIMNGVGNSLLMQGGFLLVFDVVMWLVHKQHWKKNEVKIFEQLELTGAGLRWKIP